MRDEKKREKINQIALLLKGALSAEAKVGLKMNVPKEHLDRIVKMLPSLTAPTVSPLYESEWFAVESVIDEGIVRETDSPAHSKRGGRHYRVPAQ